MIPRPELASPAWGGASKQARKAPPEPCPDGEIKRQSPAHATVRLVLVLREPGEHGAHALAGGLDGVRVDLLALLEQLLVAVVAVVDELLGKRAVDEGMGRGHDEGSYSAVLRRRRGVA